MSDHPTIAALKETAQDAETLMQTFDCANAWESEVRLLGNVRAGDMAKAIHAAIVAVNAAPHLLARVAELEAVKDSLTTEVLALRAALEAARVAVTGLPTNTVLCACAEFWPGQGHPNDCPTVKLADASAALRLALGLEVKP